MRAGEPVGRRRDIQVLRAVAALGVVLFHLWPNRLSGGYVGVDVFFVISGFLITGSLIRDDAPNPWRRLRGFWVRRIRRLLPAAMLVIAVTLLGVFAWAPESVRVGWITEAMTSTVYVENWALALQAVDYWAADAVASPFQHYWSLSVEEQFYAVWPLLLLGAGLLMPRRGAAAVIAAVGVASFAFAVANPWTGGYFDTFGRAWEFALGAGLSLAPTFALRRLRVPLAVVGWAMIAIAFVVLPAAAGVPGWAALLPTLGAAAVILSAVEVGPAWAVGLGNISYPVYLWHWPLVVFVPLVVGRELGTASKVAILVATILLSVITHRLVEQPLRVRTRAALVTTAAAVVVVVAVSVTAIVVADRAAHADEEAVQQRLADHPGCFGAAAVINDCPTGDGAVLPSLQNWQADIPGSPECYSQSASSPTVSCTFGDGPVRVAVVGNSHAELLVEGFRERVDEFGWKMDTYVGRGSVFRWAGEPDSVIDDSLAAGDYDLVIVAYNRADENFALTADDDPRVPILEQAFARTIALGVPVVALGDNPTVPADALACVEQSTDARSCSFSADDAFRYHDAVRAAADASGAAMIEFDGVYCSAGACPMVLGDVLVYRDDNHVTATFMRTLAPYVMADAMETVGLPVPAGVLPIRGDATR